MLPPSRDLVRGGKSSAFYYNKRSLRNRGQTGEIKRESEILKSDESCISNPKSRNLKMDWSNQIFRDFGFEMQDSSDFKISDFHLVFVSLWLVPIIISSASHHPRISARAILRGSMC